MNETHIGECNDSKTYTPMYKRYLKNKTSRYEGYNTQVYNHHAHASTTMTSPRPSNLDRRDKVLRCQCHRKLLSTVSLHLIVSVSYLRYVCLQVFGDSQTLAHTFRWWVDRHSQAQVQEQQISLKVIPSNLRFWAMTPKLLVHREQCLCCYRTQCLHIGFLNSYVRCEHWRWFIHERNMKWRSKVNFMHSWITQIVHSRLQMACSDLVLIMRTNCKEGLDALNELSTIEFRHSLTEIQHTTV